MMPIYVVMYSLAYEGTELYNVTLDYDMALISYTDMLKEHDYADFFYIEKWQDGKFKATVKCSE